MQKKWNEYQIIDTRQLVNKLPEDEREQYKLKALFKNKALTDSVMMFSKADFKKYRENYDAFIVGKIRKRQKHYKVYEKATNGSLLSYPPQSITVEELISKKQKKNIIGSATMEYPEFAEKVTDKQKCKLSDTDKPEYSKMYDVKEHNNSHTVGYAYIGDNKFLQVTTFNIANRDKYDASNLDTAYGFYCGGSNGTAESTINAVQNFNKCVINNGDTRSQSGICLQRNYKYNAPKEVNLTDCELYSGWRGIYFNSLSGKDYPSVTKVNLYGNTKLYDSKGVLITKQQLADAIAVWKTKEQGSHKTYPCASTTGLRTTANTYVIVGEGWATEKGVVNAYATEDCGVYDYR